MKRGRKRTGSVDFRKGHWVARVKYVDEFGNTREREHRAANRGAAKKLLDQILDELDASGDRAPDKEIKTVRDLCAFYERHYATPPDIRGGVKTAGLKSHEAVKFYLADISKVLGGKRIKELSAETIWRYRELRLATKTKAGKPRALSSVHRELSYLRRCLNIAVEKGWLTRNPFPKGIIQPRAENKRDIVITKEQEVMLLKACEQLPRCGHLRNVLILALELGLRKQEILKCSWGDVDFKARSFRVRPENSKTEREYSLGLSSRALAALKECYENAADTSANERVFNFASIKKSWTAVRNHVGLPDVWFRDTRRANATRLAEIGVPISMISKQLGHKTTEMTSRYLGLSEEAAQTAANALDDWHARQESQAQTPFGTTSSGPGELVSDANN